MLIREFLIIGRYRQSERIKNVFPISMVSQHVTAALPTEHLGIPFVIVISRNTFYRFGELVITTFAVYVSTILLSVFVLFVAKNYYTYYAGLS